MLEATVVLQVRHLDSAREGIASLLAQTMSADKMELIIIDAGLDDNDAEMLRTMAAEEPKLRLVSAPIDEGSAPSNWPERKRRVPVRKRLCGPRAR